MMWAVRSSENSVNTCIHQSLGRNVQESWVVINAAERISYPALHKITFCAVILVPAAETWCAHRHAVCATWRLSRSLPADINNQKQSLALLQHALC